MIPLSILATSDILKAELGQDYPEIDFTQLAAASKLDRSIYDSDTQYFTDVQKIIRVELYKLYRGNHFSVFVEDLLTKILDILTIASE